MLSGNFGRKGTNQLHSWLQPLWGNSPNQIFAPTGDAIFGGLLPPNIFPEAVLKDHPDRLRCAWIDSSNPANTAANTEAVERALRSLDLCVVVDVAMTETAQLAHYVLPASSQFEKTEFTLFNFEFPTNYFHVRAGVLPPLAGTLPEPEIYTRLAIALGLLPGYNVLAPLREAARRSEPSSPCLVLSSRRTLLSRSSCPGALPRSADASGWHGGCGPLWARACLREAIAASGAAGDRRRTTWRIISSAISVRHDRSHPAGHGGYPARL
jgi:anaerobic selenocysteine-containing dehydrogenase